MGTKITYSNSFMNAMDRDIKDKSSINSLLLYNHTNEYTKTTATFNNKINDTISCYWLDDKNSEIFFCIIEPQKSKIVNTYTNQYWIFRYSKNKDIITYTNITYGIVFNVEMEIFSYSFLPFKYIEENKGYDCRYLLDKYKRTDINFSAFTTFFTNDLYLELYQNNAKFLDSELYDINEKYIRLSDYPNKYKLFPTYGIRGSDLFQGQIGNCWFISALSSAAEYKKNELKNIFLSQEISFYGFYFLKFFNWKTKEEIYILIDDYIPINSKGDFKYAQRTNYKGGDENCVWVALIEKAFAKLLGGYKYLDGNLCSPETSSTVFSRLFNSNPVVFSCIYKIKIGNDIIDKNFLITYIMNIFLEQPIAVTSNYNTSNDLIQDGIVNYHGYSLFNIKYVDTKNGKIYLIKLRNTWGRQEFTGEWSINSQLWKDNPELVNLLKEDFLDDGTFWISFEDFSYKYINLWY